LASIISPRPEYNPGEEAVMVNREAIRCNITEPMSNQMVNISPKKITRTSNGGAVTKKDNRELRHIFFDSNFLYIVTVDINRVGYGVVEEAVPLFTVQVCWILIILN